MQVISIVGFAAGTLTTISFIPQVHKTWRTRSCDDLSWGMLLAFTTGVVLWLVYGLFLLSEPIIAANAATLALLVMIIALKAKFRAQRGESARKSTAGEAKY